MEKKYEIIYIIKPLNEIEIDTLIKKIMSILRRYTKENIQYRKSKTVKFAHEIDGHSIGRYIGFKFTLKCKRSTAALRAIAMKCNTLTNVLTFHLIRK